MGRKKEGEYREVFITILAIRVIGVGFEVVSLVQCTVFKVV